MPRLAVDRMDTAKLITRQRVLVDTVVDLARTGQLSRRVADDIRLQASEIEKELLLRGVQLQLL